MSTKAFLEDHLGYHELAVEDALSEHERPSIQAYADHLFFSLSVVEMGNGQETFTELSVFVRETSVVTVARVPCPLVETWFERWKSAPESAGTEPAWVAHTLVDAVVDGYFPVADHVENAIEDLADDLFDGKPFELEQIREMRHRILELRKRIAPTRDVLNYLLRRDGPFPKELAPYFQDVYDHTLRILENLESQRESVSGLMEAHMSMVSNNLNDVMKKMTVISTMLMAAALIAGIYGMNFARMPELNWPWGYPFAIVLMALSALIALVFFRWRRWI
jgi:magnesium transporter